MKPKIVLFVGYFVAPEMVVREIKDHFGEDNVAIAMLYEETSLNNPAIQRKIQKSSQFADISLACNMTSLENIKEALAPHNDQLITVTTRGESFLQEFSQVIQVLPDHVPAPTLQAIVNTSDKNAMRIALADHDRSIIPGFLQLEDGSEASVQRVLSELSFPLIVKPSGLSTSMLVTRCNTEAELRQSMEAIFAVINTRYAKFKGRGKPTVLVEEFMAGKLYSVDAYIDARGVATFCPAVEIVTAVEAGKEDYYGFSQIVPAALAPDDEAAMQQVAQQSVSATGLISSSAHIELIHTENGWKIVELGPRTGGQRTVMYELSFGIKHSLNDVLTRTAEEKPHIPQTQQQFVAYVKLYGETEGIVDRIKGEEKLHALPSYHKHTIAIQPGEEFLFARNGGLAAVDLILAHEDKNQLEHDIQQADKLVAVIVKG